jgi:hypothetical protein
MRPKCSVAKPFPMAASTAKKINVTRYARRGRDPRPPIP